MWGVTRSWSPDMTGTGSLGNHWYLSQMPQLVQETTADVNRPSGATATIIEVSSGTDQRWFDYFSGTGWVERYGGQDTLVDTTVDGTSVFVLTDTTGTQTYFFDFSSSNGAQEGQFLSSYDSYGNVTQVTSTDSSGEITEVQRSNGSTVESWLYTYTTIAGSSLITNIMLRRSTDGGSTFYTVSQVGYTYYGSGASNGNVNDLESVQIREGGPGTLSGSLASGTGLTVSQPYYYQVTAVTSLGETSVSPEFTITPTTSGTQDVNLSWSAYPDAISYNIYRATTSGSEQQIVTGITGTTYTDAGGQTPSSAPPLDVTDTDYYVYWLSGQYVTEGGSSVLQPQGALKYVFSSESYARMAAALPSGTTPATATNAELSPYADSYYAYDSSGRVYQATIAGQGGGSSGQGTFTYAYSSSSNSASFNHWANKTVETLPDSSTETVYSNYAGEPMLEVEGSGGDQWGTFYEYNSSGQVILEASPSSINLPSSLSTLESNADLLHSVSGSYQYLSTDSGQITLIDYYSSTSATSSTAGGVTGYYEDAKIEQGQAGTAVLQETRTYFSNTSSGSVTIYPVAADTVYRNTNGTGGETTSYGYSFYSGTNQVQTETVTLPTIPGSENGPNTTDDQTYTLDQYNRVTAYVDGDGYETDTSYDMGTGGITETKVDSAGLALTTDYVVNGSGQDTEITDPNGNTTYIIYLALSHATLTYPGWHEIGTSGNYTSTGPVQVEDEYYPAANASSGQQTLYYETLTIDPPVEPNTTPEGNETIDATDIQSLSRSLTNAAGQVYETDAYSSLAGLTYSTATPQLSSAAAGSNTASGNYSATAYGYDSRGRVDHVVDPNGTITDTTDDALGRTTSISQGTNDTTSNNMVDVQDDYYDQRQSAPSAPTLSQTSGGSLAGATYYVIVTYVGGSSESLGSTETSHSVSASNLLTISSPAARTGATGYNVYVATSSGQETQQNSSPIAIGTGWTEPTGGLVAGSLPPVDQVGDSDLTQVTSHPGGGGADRVTKYLYDWRDRELAVKLGVQSSESTSVHRPIYFYSLDNLGEVTGTYQYDADGVSLGDFSSGQPSADAGKLRAQTLTSYDEQQRPYLYQTYEVNLISGAVSSTNVLSTNLYYNNRNNVIAESDPGGQVTKYTYDGADRETMESITDGGVLNGATQNWTNADSTSSDIVVEQIDSTYDADGNLIETVDRQRFDNDPSTSSGEGNLEGPSGTNPDLDSRDYYTDYYYDAADRLTAEADVGTNQGYAWSEPGSPDSPSDNYLLTTYGYAADAVQTVTISGSPTGGTFTLTFDGQTTGSIAYNAPANGTSSVESALAALSNIGSGNVAVTGGNGGPYSVRFMGSLSGSIEPTMTAASSLTGGSSPSVSAVTSVVGGDGGRVQSITDPRGLATVTDYDLLGRTLTTIAGFSTGVPANATDQTTGYTYDANGDVLTMTAMQPSGGATPNQTTGYVYGVGGTAGTSLFSNDLLATTEYPNPSTGAPSTSSANEENLGYNFLGQETKMTDRNGTTHSYSYDVLGRLITDSAQVASGNPQNVDTTVQSLLYSYNTLGLPYQQTSYSSPLGSGSVVNQVTDGYNGFGQLTSQIQNLGGSPTISGTVNYIYSETNNGTENNSRLQATVYPDNRVVDDDYSPQQSPISSITHSGTTATVTTASANGLSAGQTVTISGATPSAYDGTFTIASITSSTQFTYTTSSTPSSNASGSYMAVAAQSLDNVISRADGLQDHSTGTVLDAYSYLGLSTVVQEAHPQSGIDLTYISQSGDPNPPPSSEADGGDRYGGLDQFGRVDDQYYLNPSTPSSPTDDFQYAYDQDGNPLYKDIVNQGSTAATFSQLYHSNGASESNAYDSLNRLTSFAQGTLSASVGGGQLDTVTTATTTQSWSLDALGNWSSVTTNGTAQTRSVNSQNELTAVSSATTPTYDHNGNMTKDQNGTTYTYDAWNRMASETSGTTIMDLGYLAGGQRASIAFSGSTADYSFFNNAWQEIETESNTGPTGSTVVQDTYVWGLANINELVARDDSSGNRIYVQQDANWDVTALIGKVSGTWQVVERFSYTPYGVATVLTASWGSTTDSHSWIYRYQAGKFDSVSGLYNFRNRDYSPSLGQWLEADPAGYVKGANLYEANLGAPISHVDPYGLTPGTGSGGDGNNANPSGGATPPPTTQPTTPPTTQPAPPVPAAPPPLPPGWHYEWDPYTGTDWPVPDAPQPPPDAPPSPWEPMGPPSSTPPTSSTGGPYGSLPPYGNAPPLVPPDTDPDFGPFSNLAKQISQNGLPLGGNWYIGLDPYPGLEYNPGPSGGVVHIGPGTPPGYTEPGSPPGSNGNPLNPYFHITISPP